MYTNTYIYIYIYICIHCVCKLRQAIWPVAEWIDRASISTNTILSYIWYMYKYIYICVYTYIYTYIYIYIYIYIHCVCKHRQAIWPTAEWIDGATMCAPATSNSQIPSHQMRAAYGNPHKSPIHPQKSPMYPQKSPVYPQQSPAIFLWFSDWITCDENGIL